MPGSVLPSSDPSSDLSGSVGSTRRTVLALMASLAGLPLAAGAAAAFEAPGVPGPAVRRYGRHYIVNGWILTAEDLGRLGIHAG
jgi:hypothetical protein